MTVALVVPTCRPDQLRNFLDAWCPVRFWDELIVVEDGHIRSCEVPSGTHHLTWNDIDNELGTDSWIISRRDSAVRSIGFLKAWKLGVDLIVTLDDDTRPIQGVDHMAAHRAAMYHTPVWVSTVPGLRVRGLPYGTSPVLPNVMLNVGLWRGVPDLDAISTLAHGCPTDFSPQAGSRILARGQYAPICGMNLAFRRDFAPLAYFGLQGDGWPFCRFDDIWMGVVAKHVCDHIGWSIAVGVPHVQHDRASDPFVNIVKESPGVVMNERLWSVIDNVRLTGTTAPRCLHEIGATMLHDRDVYVQRLGNAIQVWASLFQESL
jgi:reversibly glycosylated polypeptide / UDP-arabinopyranose mutase